VGTKKTGSLIIWSLALVVLVAALVVWLVQRRPEETTDTRPLVLATAPHVAVWLQNILGDDIHVESIVTPGVEVHDFSFTTEDVARANTATAIVASGAGLESWLSDFQETAPEVPVIDTSIGVDLIEGDPHIWLDPDRASVQIQTASSALQELFPDQAQGISQRTADYLTEIGVLETQIGTQLESLEQRNFIAFHESFGYFSEHYGLSQVAHIVETPGESASLEVLNQVRAAVEQYDIKALFIEPGPVPDIARTIEKDFGLTLVVLDPMEGLPLEHDAYVIHMKNNATALVDGLSL
jgi:ABC-type Zn uptake system ZnuABC Zn-binding protein ZnuA